MIFYDEILSNVLTSVTTGVNVSFTVLCVNDLPEKMTEILSELNLTLLHWMEGAVCENDTI